MALSDYEKQVLSQMEQQLASDDPNLATKLRAGAPTPGVGQPRLVGWGVVFLLLGMVVLISGVSLGSQEFTGAMVVSAIVGVVGFVAMVFGVLKIISGIRGTSPQSSSPDRTKPGFMERQQSRWDTRDSGI